MKLLNFLHLAVISLTGWFAAIPVIATKAYDHLVTEFIAPAIAAVPVPFDLLQAVLSLVEVSRKTASVSLSRVRAFADRLLARLDEDSPGQVAAAA